MVNILENIVTKYNSLYNTVKLTAVAALMSATMNAQSGSGTHTATTEDNQTTAINLQGTSTFDTGNYQFNLTGNLGTPIDFTEWPLMTLGTQNFDLSENMIMGPTSKELNAYFKFENPQDVKAQLFDINGRNLGTIQTINNNNGFTQLFYDGSSLADGVYIAQVKAGNQQDAFKVPLVGRSSDGMPNPLPQHTSNKLMQKNNSSMSRMDVTNYNVTITGEHVNDYSEDIEVEVGTNNAFEFTVIPKNGDTAVLPQLNGSPIDNTTITLENQSDTSRNYSANTQGSGTQLGIFENIYVTNPSVADTYEITITSNDGLFLPTTVSEDMFQDINGEVNGLKTIEVDAISNEQDITTVVRDYETLTTLPGITVNLYQEDEDNDPSNDVLLNSQVSNSNGQVIFYNVPGETPVYIANTADGYYTKTNGTYNVPLVDLISEMDTTLNVTAVPKYNYEDATPVEADMISRYKPLADHTPFALNEWRVYFPEAAQRETVVDHFAEVAATLDNEGAIIPSDTPFALPTDNGTYESYQPYPQNREVHSGLIGTNITNYSGTGTNIGEKVLPSGENITFFTNSFNLGGLDWSATDHEIGNALGFPLLTGTDTFQTSRDSSAADNVAIIDSQWDKAIMPLWINMAKLHYDTTDTQERLIEYSMPNNFQE